MDPAGLWKIWSDPQCLLDYQPVKASVVWFQWRLWHDDPFGYHLTNVVLHLLGALLVWRLFDKLGLRLAWFGGLLFAVHPVTVESVAWISELKNTLSLPPFLLAMIFYLDYDAQGRRRDYYLALGLFIFAMLVKTTMALFPLVILLYAWWKRGRMGIRDLKTIVPFLFVSLVLGWVTLWFAHRNMSAGQFFVAGGFLSRAACAGLILSFYFSVSFLPVGLLTIYPKWPVDPPSLVQFLPWVVILALFFWLWKKRHGWGRHALLGLGFFVINLAPFLGFNRAPYMHLTWVTNHILYLPLIGLIGLAVSGLAQLLDRLEEFSQIARLYVWLLACGVAAVFRARESSRGGVLPQFGNALDAYARVQSFRLDGPL